MHIFCMDYVQVRVRGFVQNGNTTFFYGAFCCEIEGFIQNWGTIFLHRAFLCEIQGSMQNGYTKFLHRAILCKICGLIRNGFTMFLLWHNDRTLFGINVFLIVVLFGDVFPSLLDKSLGLWYFFKLWSVFVPSCKCHSGGDIFCAWGFIGWHVCLFVCLFICLFVCLFDRGVCLVFVRSLSITYTLSLKQEF